MSGLLVATAVALTLALSQRERGQSRLHACLRQKAHPALLSLPGRAQSHCSLSPWERAGVRATASHANPSQRTIA